MSIACGRTSRAIVAALALSTSSISVSAAGFMYFKPADIVGESPGAKAETWLIGDSFSFGVEREMKESGEKGGTTDINIGIGEMQAGEGRSKLMDNSTQSTHTASRDGTPSAGRGADIAQVDGEIVNPGTGTTSGMATGKRQHAPVRVTKEWDRSTPLIADSFQPRSKGSLTILAQPGKCRVGNRYPSAEFGTRKRIYHLQDIVVVGCAQTSSDGIPMEQVSMNYERIK